MSQAATARTLPGDEPFEVKVEAASYIAQFAGGTDSASVHFRETARPGATVRDVLRGLSNRFPKLAEVLWQGNDIGEHVEVVVNDAFLGVEHTLDSRLKPGDSITLIGQFTGG